MITANVWERVVRIQCGAAIGTGFTLDYEGSQYLVTARHVVDGPHPPEVRVRGNPIPVDLSRLTISVVEADVAVFRVNHPITEDLSLPATMDGIVFGQDCYFLGFPWGLTFDVGSTESFPLVKRATVSGINHHVHNRPVLLLDGWNNPGFSGGPVVFRPPTSLGMQEPWRVCGVVTAYRTEPSPLMIGGKELLDAQVLLNSGIIIVEEITRAIEAITAHPI